ncbi:MAG: hypothetical protein A2571_00045 [Candidatus Vogelbacteria bacterium RIFOXYD1_FULL_44_32]|uniref:PKD domain-containing protein n=1 Tax=Candidatus Vogelbacteria bacterium RIFOXYD1_FULL_44_32 TaxID=1802438 RepID=A0A1G2QE82_9BACT|nr:MAG: hypothetical protein A2571_00045 [Candidatus Vogelbacteria bacterium RIFOXYD1_FULL_44_32]
MKYLLRFLVLAVLVVAPGYVLAAPTINSVTGPSVLNVGQSGTWTVVATSQASGGITGYSFNPGDGTGNKSNQSTNTSTYSFSRAGTFTLTFTASDSTGSNSSTKTVTVNPVVPATISAVNIQDNQPVWIYQETAKNITWSYSGIPTDRNLKFRYGAWNNVDNRWVNFAHMAVTQASGTGTGYQTAGTTNLSNIDKPLVERVVLVDANYNEYQINGAIIQARAGSQPFTIKRRGVATATFDSSSFTTQTEMFKGASGVETARVDAVISVRATDGDVYIHPNGTGIVVKNNANQVVSISSSESTKIGLLRINGVDSTSSSVSQFVRWDTDGFAVYVIKAGTTEKFHVRLTFRKDKLPNPGQYSAAINSIRVGQIDGLVLNNQTTNLAISGNINLATPTVWPFTATVLKGQTFVVDGIGLRDRALAISGVTPAITPTYINLGGNEGAVRLNIPTTSLVPGNYSFQFAGMTGSWNFTVTGPAQSAPTVPKITSVVVEDFPLVWTNRVAANPVTVTYEGLPRGKVIQLYFKSDLNNGNTTNIPPANDRTTISTSGGFRVNIYPNILDANLLNKEYYVVAKVMNPDGTVYRVNGASIEARSANRFQIIPNTTASADTENQLANTTGASKSLWEKFVDWLL